MDVLNEFWRSIVGLQKNKEGSEKLAERGLSMSTSHGFSWFISMTVPIKVHRSVSEREREGKNRDGTINTGLDQHCRIGMTQQTGSIWSTTFKHVEVMPSFSHWSN